VNNENFSEINFTKLNSPINRISSVSFMVFNDMITYILPNLTFLLIVSFYFLYKNIIFGGIFVIGNIIFLLYLLYNWNSMMKYNNDYEKYVGDNESYLVEILNNIDKIIFRGQVNSEIETYSEKTNTSIDKAFSFYSNTNYHGIIMTIIMFITIFVCLGFIIYLFLKNKLDLKVFITFFTIILLYREKMMTIIQQIPDFIEFFGRSEAVLKHFKSMSIDIFKETKKYNHIELPFKQIRFENVSFKYTSNEKPTFQNLNLSIETNDKIIGLTGLSGNGKSTLVKLLLKLYKLQNGNIFIDGENIENIDANYIRENITYVNQTSKLFDKKIIDNILYGCNNIDSCNENLKEVLRYSTIRDLFKNLDIFNKNSGSLGENLSGGQRQVINIISGLINPSKILILDEPTNALDPALKIEVLNLIKEFKKYKQCIIIITHDRDVYSILDEKIQI
jgi:ABC-type bacteriocin/lantibiotic exporter with double-glycine peptidase domain